DGYLDQVSEALRGQLAVSASDAGGNLRAATGVQVPGALDDLYPYDGELGVSWSGAVPTISVWAPTAKSVALVLYADGAPATTGETLAMTRDDTTGVWSITGTSAWKGRYYVFDVEVWAPVAGAVVHNLVTDPYSLALATNSTRSLIVDLADPALAPSGWTSLTKPSFSSPEEMALYELHIRDFSINDPTVPAGERGTYLAFTRTAANGMRHLRSLADAGLTHVHLLPGFDIATIEEDRSLHEEPPCDLEIFGPDSPEQQACITQVAASDGFNWGYDPWHYTAPEGSYATNPEGWARTLQFRQMVAALNQSGLRVVMDVVYNHTNAAGQDEHSVLDRIVPGYYHRLLDDGTLATSTCCANTATEHAMMEKLMVDSIVTWARQYKVDGFRFDLMGHHSLANMLAVRAALDGLTLAEDGVDGSQIYVYGEGWNFGEVANNVRFEQATQLNMAGTGIGTFNDRLRDAVRGGGPFDVDQRVRQGFASGLHYDPNGVAGTTPAEQRAALLDLQDQIKVGLTGNLRDYEFVDRFGNAVTGADIDYNGSPAGYTTDPQEAITYVSAHDNETLFDILAYKLPQDTTMADRRRSQIVALSTVALGQGVPFFHAGTDLLRSKSLDRNSYDSGDWFNRLFFDYSSNNFGVGLPRAADNQSAWPIQAPLLADPDLRAGGADITWTTDRFAELLEIRGSSPLFALGDAESIQERVSFPTAGPNQPAGLIVMELSDEVGTDLDPSLRSIVVLINASDTQQTVTLADAAGGRFRLHDVQEHSGDDVVRKAKFKQRTGTFTVPARTTAVFVELQQGS
ncbi:MAG: pullulanase-type alpha-1,6-glucosidase, partial [Candidatus Limnocylindria bacterium]